MSRILDLQKMAATGMDLIGFDDEPIIAGSSCSWIACGGCSTNSAVGCDLQTQFIAL